MALGCEFSFRLKAGSMFPFVFNLLPVIYSTCWWPLSLSHSVGDSLCDIPLCTSATILEVLRFQPAYVGVHEVQRREAALRHSTSVLSVRGWDSNIVNHNWEGQLIPEAQAEEWPAQAFLVTLNQCAILIASGVPILTGKVLFNLQGFHSDTASHACAVSWKHMTGQIKMASHKPLAYSQS